MEYILLIIGFVLLIKGADYFVEGASNIAVKLNVSPLLVGLTIVALGTSSPEATVAILAALEGSPGVVLGNVIGSNIVNITVVVGLTALIAPLTVQSETVRKEIPFAMLAAIVLMILMADVALQGAGANIINRGDGIIILLFFSVFLYYVFEMARKNRSSTVEKVDADTGESWLKNILFTIGGLIAIIIGGEMVVSSATEIALSLGMSEALVGLTIVAIGTSLPEIMTSVTAALKGKGDMAIGNVVGSNIFNIFFVTGTASTVAPIAAESKLFFDGWVMVGLTVLLLIFSRTHFKIGRREGAVLLLAYITYLVYIIIRN
ncbi:calcium/sodium antiporter [Salinicoccus roseus]|uniref:Calcium/sodium antiporter n=1 Tax=Salinicoccus roseus TaxID=45670 RepID=A0A0C2DIU7_9STAP|nr:calcium/sodium antiporter [Salinicoccus roseus]KIH69868.1 sodium:proton exchanger [Salinicoccus roseus]MBY8909453.1 calcium/sodium antiporter [Salinicoccus roseus]MDB0579295.1 calcium/sodium antiporter [Salinicoccus roseus]